MTVTQMSRKEKRSVEMTTLTPEMAMKLLDLNKLNRPLSQSHVNRIISQIKEGKWKWNGDTIKISAEGDIVDGQHRLWAIVESKKPVETVVVHGVPRDAFATIDTMSKPRNAGDILALNGVTEFRPQTGLALTWLIRWQRGKMRGPESRVENSEVETAYSHHPGMVQAVAKASAAVKGMTSPGLFGFLYYIFASRDPELANEMLDTLSDPSGVKAGDPFFRLRAYLLSERYTRKDPLVTMALAIKAGNLWKAGKQIERLKWNNQGDKPEPFPKMEF